MNDELKVSFEKEKKERKNCYRWNEEGKKKNMWFHIFQVETWCLSQAIRYKRHNKSRVPWICFNAI